MATIEELEQRAEEISRAEKAAISALVEHLRGAAVELPDDSRLAFTFAVYAKKLEETAGWPSAASAGATLTISDLAREIERDRRRRLT